MRVSESGAEDERARGSAKREGKAGMADARHGGPPPHYGRTGDLPEATEISEQAHAPGGTMRP